jgi:crotonobetainyl-CoA:carnitine CoA-transferase CaiB-like acyl-CoA transferase
MILEGPAWYGDAMPPPNYNPAPTIGQHTVEVVRGLLGLSDAAIEELIDTGVLESTAPPGEPPE